MCTDHASPGLAKSISIVIIMAVDAVTTWSHVHSKQTHFLLCSSRQQQQQQQQHRWQSIIMTELQLLQGLYDIQLFITLIITKLTYAASGHSIFKSLKCYYVSRHTLFTHRWNMSC